ncbi:MAG: AtpZ/AtpI family protein [Bacillota bacterium]
MSNVDQNNKSKKEEKNNASFRERLIIAFKNNYTTSVFLLCMVIGWILDLGLNTLPRYTVTGMVVGAVVGSCLSVKKRNDEKEREDRKNGKKYM